MVAETKLQNHLNDTDGFFSRAVRAVTVESIHEIMRELPILDENQYSWRSDTPAENWREGFLHWIPVGRDRGNAGRIQLAGAPENPIGERTVNAMESIIEMARQLEIKNGWVSPPSSPRDAVRRYFDLPPLAELPTTRTLIHNQKPPAYARDLAKRIRLRLIRDKQDPQYAVLIEDDGIGQAPANMHTTLLSLGSSNKGDKPYLIGVFGQGGSSTFATSEYSWIVSRRHHELLDGNEDGVGWTIVRKVAPKGRRDPYYAYLAAHPDGRTPAFPSTAADKIGLTHGSRFAHIKYNFGNMDAIKLYSALNHLLFSPVLPYEIYTRPNRGADLMSGNSYRLSKNKDKQVVLDKVFQQQTVERR